MENIKNTVKVQALNILFSLSGICIKLASLAWQKYGFLSMPAISYIAIAVLIMGIYAVLWQLILSRMSLSVAYLNKGLTIFWSTLWAVIIFGEQLTATNVIGLVIVFAGVCLVAGHE